MVRVGSRVCVREALLALLAGAVFTASASAQAIRGHLMDDEQLTPVGGATITLLSGDSRGPQVLTQDDGSFFIALEAWGTFRLEATRIGYGTTTSQPFQVEPRDTVTVDFRVLPDAVLLRPITVTARTNQGRSAFYRRMDDWGEGLFITPDMVDSIQPRHPMDVLRHQPKIWLSWDWVSDQSSGVAGLVPNVHSLQGDGCLTYMIDGHVLRRPKWARLPVWLDYPLNTLQPDDIEAVEVYRNLDEVPPELRRGADELYDGNPPQGIATFSGSAEPVQVDFIPKACGIVNFWTRAGW